MKSPTVVSRNEWLEKRREYLQKEKEFTKLREQLSLQRRNLPWVKIDKDYIFEGPNGKESLSDLFEGHSQLIVQHFMFGPEWKEGCPSCSFWADNFDNIMVHLNHRDISMVVVSRSSFENLNAYKERMGWRFKWMSSLESDFNFDFNVSFSPEVLARDEMNYNFGTMKFNGEEAHGISVFYKNDKGEIFHTYSTYSRGLDMLNSAYHLMDLVPKGRDEDALPYTMAWLRRHDSYGSN